MAIRIDSYREFPSEIVLQETFDVESIVSEDARLFAVVDAHVAWFYEKHFGKLNNINHYVFKDPSENTKTMATVSDIINFLLEHNAKH